MDIVLFYVFHVSSWGSNGVSNSSWNAAYGIWLCWTKASCEGCLLRNGFYVSKVRKQPCLDALLLFFSFPKISSTYVHICISTPQHPVPGFHLNYYELSFAKSCSVIIYSKKKQLVQRACGALSTILLPCFFLLHLLSI